MINRVLIRIKVVQLLYSYLLTQSEFKIESLPENPSRDKKYAYSLYLDLLAFILRISGYKLPSASSNAVEDNRYLSANKIVRALNADDQVRTILMRNSSNVTSFDGALRSVYDAIVNSSIYRSYIRQKDSDIQKDMTFWSVILRTIIAKNECFIEEARKNPYFTNLGFENAIKMAVSTLESYCDNRTLLSEARNALDKSLDKAYELYHALLLLSVELTRTQDMRLEAAKQKHLPTPEDLNPNMRFVDNALPRMIIESPDMKEYLKNNPISWVEDDSFIKSMLNSIINSDIYAEYMAKETTDVEADCEFWRMIYKNVILPSDELAEILESKSVYWNDDLQIMGTFVLKSIKRAAACKNGIISLLPQYKDEEDEQFGPRLFLDAVDNRETYRSYIDRFINSDQWDPERLAFMDIVIMITAIAELLNFPAIPIPVTLNEYIEIANSYSTQRSGQFINGILYSVINYLKDEQLLCKN